MSLLDALPAPTRGGGGTISTSLVNATSADARTSVKEPPPYGHRRGFVPRRPEDYGDGGAFPEIHVAQFPLGMGRPRSQGERGTLALTVGEDGATNFDAIVTAQPGSNKWVASRPESLRPKLDVMRSDLAPADEEEVRATAVETAEALRAAVQRKQASVNPATLPKQPGEAQFIRYTPAGAGSGAAGGGAHAGGAATRIIRMQDAAVDPLEPPKFRHVKVPRGGAEPPVPVLHSPPRKLSTEDAAQWKIPPCISNWKNSKGYVIPLHARLAADGRGLTEAAISDRFAAFSEAMYVAEGSARDAVEARASVQRELLTRDKARREQELREMAARARADRLGGDLGSAAGGPAASRARAAADGPSGANVAPLGERRPGKPREDSSSPVTRPRRGNSRSPAARSRGGDSRSPAARSRRDSRSPAARSRRDSRSPAARSRRDSRSPAARSRRDSRSPAARSRRDDSRSPAARSRRDDRRSPAARSRRSDSRSPPSRSRARDRSPAGSPAARSRSSGSEDSEDREARRLRDLAREDRRRERERARRSEARDTHAGNKSKLARDRDRDISERVALGQAKVGAGAIGEAMYDARLFNQEAGVGGGLNQDDEYNLYDKPLFADRSEVFRGRATRAAEEDAPDGSGAGERRFRPDRGFGGVDYDAAPSGSGAAPAFERDPASAAGGDDPFGLDRFLSEVRGAATKRGTPLDGAPRGGSMYASAGGASTGDGSKRRHFVRERGDD